MEREGRGRMKRADERQNSKLNGFVSGLVAAAVIHVREHVDVSSGCPLQIALHVLVVWAVVSAAVLLQKLGLVLQVVVRVVVVAVREDITRTLLVANYTVVSSMVHLALDSLAGDVPLEILQLLSRAARIATHA